MYKHTICILWNAFLERHTNVSILDLEFVSFDPWSRHLAGAGNIIRVNID